MNRKLIVLLCLSFCIILGAFSYAQEEYNSRNELRGEKTDRISALKTKLGLSDKQVEQLKSLREKKAVEIKLYMKEIDQKIQNILNEEQKNLWAGKKAEVFQDKGIKIQNNIKNLKKVLLGMNLSIAQKTELKDLARQEKEVFKSKKNTLNEELRSILSAEQYKKLEELRGRKKDIKKPNPKNEKLYYN